MIFKSTTRKGSYSTQKNLVLMGVAVTPFAYWNQGEVGNVIVLRTTILVVINTNVFLIVHMPNLNANLLLSAYHFGGSVILRWEIVFNLYFQILLLFFLFLYFNSKVIKFYRELFVVTITPFYPKPLPSDHSTYQVFSQNASHEFFVSSIWLMKISTFIYLT